MGCLIIALSVVCALAVWAGQTYFWLREDEWPAAPMSLVMSAPDVGWVGLQAIIDFLYDSNIGFVAIVAGYVAATLLDRFLPEDLKG